MNLREYAYKGVSLHVREAMRHWDEGITREVAEEYYWDRLPERVTFAVDVGAHIGAWSLRLLQHHPEAVVVAVEAHRGNAALLQMNTAGCAVEVVQAAMCYRERAYLLHVNENSGGHRLTNLHEGVEVATVTLEGVTHGHDVDVLKMDCEGAELEILKQAHDDTLARVRCIVGEYHYPQDVFEREAGGRLRALGFTFETRRLASEQGMFFARRLP